MSSTPGCNGQAMLLTSRSLLVVIFFAWILLGPLLLGFPSNSYAGSSIRPQTPAPKLQSEKIYSIQAPPLSPFQITNPKNGSTNNQSLSNPESDC